tara:strand:+ start:721 stop:1125 length:405 start_codon:yes stop_codon:yes gene_type:complete
MDSSMIFGAVIAFIIINILGIAVTLAVVLYQLNVLIAGGSLVVPPDTGPEDALERMVWQKERDESLANKARLSGAYRTGVMVLIWLSVLTIVEFLASSIGVSNIAMILIALMKAVVILQFFMHVSSIWLEGDKH